jgi:DNA-binding sugar fermentation-stimulating protein
MVLLYSLPKELIKGKVLSRPSKKVKSPYLADVLLLEENKEVLCHTAALGCSGHIIEDSIVWVLEKEETNSKSSHEIYLIEENGTMIGCHPLVANKIAYRLLKNNSVLPNTKDVISEYTIGDCRFDFLAKCDDRMTVVEVKSVPIADYIDGTTKEVQSYLKEKSISKEKIAIFPYCTTANKRKLSNEPLSDRALKHVVHLTNLVKSTRCVLLFIVQRTDVSQFCITKLDPTYKDACKKALDAGVVIKAISVRWDNRFCYYEKELEIIW